MCRLPPELLSDILLLAAPHCVPVKFGLARVSRYWRAVALGTAVLWAAFEIETQATVRALPLLLHRAGRDTPLDVRLAFAPLSGASDRNNSLDLDSRDAVVLLLARPAVMARIRSLEIAYNEAGHLRRLIGADLAFPRLVRLHIVRSPSASTDGVRIALSAPNLRYLRLFRAAPRSWDSLLGPALHDLRIEHCGGDAHVTALATVLRRCPRLKKLALCTHDSAPLGVARDLFNARRALSAAGSAPPSASAASRLTASRIITTTDEEHRPLLRDLTSFQLDVPTDPINTTQILTTMADARILPRTLCTCVKTGFFVPPTAELFKSLLRGLAPLRSLSLDSVRDLTLGDSLGHERCIRVWDAYGAWDMPGVWRFLAKEYDAHRSVKKFVIDTSAWAHLADALAVVPPSGERVHASIEPLLDESRACPQPPFPSAVELVVRPHYMLVSRGEPEPGQRRSAPSQRDGGLTRVDASDDSDSTTDSDSGLSSGVDAADLLLASARASDALVHPADEDLARRWTTRMLVIPDIHKIKVDVTWAASYAQQRRAVLRVLQWVQARSRHPARRTVRATEVCVNFVETADQLDTRALELLRLAAQLEDDRRGFRLCEHCRDWLPLAA